MTAGATTETPTTAASPRGGWRFKVGATILVVGFAAPLAIPLVTSSGLPTAWKTAVSGALAVGLPEIMMVVAAAVMGKAGFARLKQLFGRVLRKYGPPERVSRVRYRVGLVMFILPLLVGWLGPYLGHHLPGFDRHPMIWHVGGDLMFLLSLLVLGGEFWDKLRSLFVYGARAVFPSANGKGGEDDG
jgi:hypothetical protein